MLPLTPRMAAPRGTLRRGLVAVAALSLALPASAAIAITVTVEQGDTLSAIAERNGVSVTDLAAANGIDNPDYIFAGQVLTLGSGGPAVAPQGSRIHTVAFGDTLSSIADQYGVTLEELVIANGILDSDYIWVGEVLSLPVSVFAPAPLSRAETETILREAAAEFGVDPALVLGLAWLESGWNQSMTSRVGAVGVMQLMPATAWWGLDYLAPDATVWETSTRDNVRLGTAVFAHM